MIYVKLREVIMEESTIFEKMEQDIYKAELEMEVL